MYIILARKYEQVLCSMNCQYMSYSATSTLEVKYHLLNHIVSIFWLCDSLYVYMQHQKFISEFNCIRRQNTCNSHLHSFNREFAGPDPTSSTVSMVKPLP
ncbi:hypothetical protein Hanom_Chr03g00212551 [Helianthus anomalus]